MAPQPAARDQAGGNFDIDLRELRFDEMHAAALILAAGMRDNPLHVRVFGADPVRRRRRLLGFIDRLVGWVRANGMLLGAFVRGELVGVLGMLEPGRCRPTGLQAVRFAGAVAAGNPPHVVMRIGRWLAVWARNDPSEAHWHLGPLAVRQQMRRQGIGRKLMTRCCACIDARDGTAFLETDLTINVAFYETLGFVVTRRESVLGVPNWFMTRAPKAGPS